MLYMQIVLLILTMFSSAAEVGVFSVAMMFIDTALVIPSMIASFVLPRWAGLSQPEVSVRASRVIRLTHPISLVIAAGCALLATVLAAPVFGKDFSGVGTLAWIMVPGAWAATGVTVISHYFLSQNRHVVPMTAAWMGTLLSGALAWGCLPVLGGAGAAMAMSVARVLVLAWMWRRFANATRETPQPLWIPRSDDIRTWAQTVNHSLHWIVRRP
jgi:O-antigen/teichoic acid export membrane protein